MAEHAMLSASGAQKWLTCTPSAVLETQFPDKGSAYATEGTLAHEMAEWKLYYQLKLNGQETHNKKMNHLKKNELYSKMMDEHTDDYADFVMETLNEAKASTPDAIIHIEQRVDFSQWVPEGFGTCDVVIIADGALTVIDFKYGQGVQVSAENNPQMMLYALGAWAEFSIFYAIESVKMIIHQPRLDAISICSMPVESLLAWAEGELKTKASLASKGEGEFCPGEHCKKYFCRVKDTCRARAEMNLELAAYDFRPTELLEDHEIADILARVDSLVSWAEGIKEYAFQEALKGKVWPGRKLVKGKSRRTYRDETAAIKALRAAGYPEAHYLVTELMGITALEKSLGKKAFNQVLEAHIHKPEGKPTLVPEEDSRPEWNSAEADFAEDIKEVI